MTARRRFLLLSAALAAYPSFALTQPASKKAVVAILHASRPEVTGHVRAAFVGRLAALGWREGANVEFLVRHADSDARRYPHIASEIVARKPSVIFVPFGPFAQAVQQKTTEIPLVFALSHDPVAQGLVASLGRPGGNVTGASTRSHELLVKRLQVLKEVLPRARRIGLIRRVGVPDHLEALSYLEELRRACAQLGLELIEVSHEYARGGEYGVAFAKLAGLRVDAVITALSWHFAHHREFVVHAAEAKLPTIADSSEFVDSGGLLALAVSYPERYAKAAEYVDRILRGAKPADLPVEEPTVFELVVNMKTARALGIAIPQLVVLRADRVIE